jgi:hypothetical protein
VEKKSKPKELKRRYEQGPSIRKKITILFFVYFGMQNNKIHKIYKKTSVFVLIFTMLFCFYQQSSNNNKSPISLWL